MNSSSRLIPEPFLSLLREARDRCEDMSRAALKIGLSRKFSLDGRLLGDIGEVITFTHFEVALHEKQKTGHDALCTKSGRKVEVKLRSKAKNIELEHLPISEILLVIELCPEALTWRVIFNGPVDKVPPGRLLPNGKRHIRLSELEKAYLSLGDNFGLTERQLHATNTTGEL